MSASREISTPVIILSAACFVGLAAGGFALMGVKVDRQAASARSIDQLVFEASDSPKKKAVLREVLSRAEQNPDAKGPTIGELNAVAEQFETIDRDESVQRFLKRPVAETQP